MKVVWIYHHHHLCSEQNNGHLYEIHPITIWMNIQIRKLPFISVLYECHTCSWYSNMLEQPRRGYMCVCICIQQQHLCTRAWTIKWLTGNTKALVIDGSFTTVTDHFVRCSCGISLLLLISWLATLTTLSKAGWDGGKNLSLYNSICWNMTNHNGEQTEEKNSQNVRVQVHNKTNLFIVS